MICTQPVEELDRNRIKPQHKLRESQSPIKCIDDADFAKYKQTDKSINKENHFRVQPGPYHKLVIDLNETD